MITAIKRLICKLIGHKWQIYAFSTGYYSYDVEQAGYCERCGYDTHGGCESHWQPKEQE